MTLLVQPMQSAAPLGPQEWPAENTPVNRFLAAIQSGIDPGQLGPRPPGVQPAERTDT